MFKMEHGYKYVIYVYLQMYRMKDMTVYLGKLFLNDLFGICLKANVLLRR